MYAMMGINHIAKRSSVEDRNTPAGKELLFQSRKASFGDQKFTGQMVPGYTGYIPKSQHYYGNRYAEGCRDAIASFEQDQQGEKKKKNNMKTVQQVQSGKLKPSSLPEGTKVCRSCPLRQLPDNKPGRFNNVSTNEKHHSMSPYYMKDDDPQKWFMSGYTGNVPNARDVIGAGYPVLTNRALVKFTNDPNHRLVPPEEKCCKADATGKVPVGPPVRTGPTAGKLPPMQEKIVDEMRRLCGRQLPVIYPIESGLVPHYTGHIPGQKFRYGTTFGHSTRNVKREPNKTCSRSS
nr:protein FAM166B-like [Lytechinus pictus]